MAANISLDNNTSINNRVRQDGTLIEENIELNIHSENTVSFSRAQDLQSRSSKSFFRFDSNYGPISFDKSNKKLPLSQEQLSSEHQTNIVSNQHMCITCQRMFKTPRGLQQHLRTCKGKQSTIPGFCTETTNSPTTPINTDDVEENIWNADIKVLHEKINET